MFSCLDMKRTTDSKTESKLDTSLETGEAKKTVEIKFTDYSINKFQSDFSKGRKTIRTNIPNSGIKVLKLRQSITTKKKYFVQQFWLDGVSDYWTIGEFREDIYGAVECRNGSVVRVHLGSPLKIICNLS